MKKRHLLKMLVSAVVLVAAHAHAQTDGPKSPADLGRLLEDVAQGKTTLVGSNAHERHDLERLGVKVSVQMGGSNYTHVLLPPGIEVLAIRPAVPSMQGTTVESFSSLLFRRCRGS